MDTFDSAQIYDAAKNTPKLPMQHLAGIYTAQYRSECGDGTEDQFSSNAGHIEAGGEHPRPVSYSLCRLKHESDS